MRTGEVRKAEVNPFRVEDGVEQVRRAEQAADADGTDRENLERPGHHRRRFMRMMADFMREFLLAPESLEIGPKRIERRQPGREETTEKQNAIDRGIGAGVP